MIVELSPYQAQQHLRLSFRPDDTDPVVIDPLYLAIFTSVHTDDMDGDEAVYGGLTPYARVPIARGSVNWIFNGLNRAQSVRAFTFPSQTTGATIRIWAVSLHDSLTGGIRLYSDNFQAAMEVENGTAPNFPAGSIQVSL